jgi:squalene-hopene/tetraprenyl-beta-curcumene cyclase
VLELLGTLGFDRQDLPVRRAVAMIRRTQEADGSWYGRWGVNYIYGTWQILRGLAAIGENMDQEWVRRARDWLESCQNDDGGWGETCESYNFPALKGRGPSTPSQTAWAVMGLCAAAIWPQFDSRGIQFLLALRTETAPGPKTSRLGGISVFLFEVRQCYGSTFPSRPGDYRKMV